MSSLCCTVILLSILPLVTGAAFRVLAGKDNDIGSKVTSGRTHISTTDITKKGTEESSIRGYNSILGEGLASQETLSDSDHKKVDKSRNSDHKFVKQTEKQNANIKNFQNTAQKSENIRASPESVGIQSFRISDYNNGEMKTDKISKEIKGEKNTVNHGQITQTYHPVANNDDIGTSDQNTHTSQKRQERENYDLKFLVGLTNDPSQITDIKSVNTTSMVMDNDSCCNISNNIADCTGCHLKNVPNNFPRNISHLLLADNDISSEALYPGVFANYPQLLVLQLDSNSITFLPYGAFEGLNSLTLLSIYNNSIVLNHELNKSPVFYPLSKTLKILIMNRNTNDSKNDNLTYPDQALCVLEKLSRLHIDGLRHKRFGIGFRNLTKLTNLSMAGFNDGYCSMISINNHTFSYLRSLTFLNLSDCNLNGSQIESNAFFPLSKLKVLDVSNNFDLGIQAVGNFMHGLRHNTNFVHLKMLRIVNRFAPCIVVYKHTLKYFKHTGLQVIEAMNNEIEMIEAGALRMLPSSLTVANLTNNRIMFGAYMKDMAFLTGLQRLHLDGYLNPVKFPLFFPSRNLHCPESKIEDVTDNSSDEQTDDQNCICGPDKCSSEEKEFILPLPPNLQDFTMHSNSLAYKIGNIKFCSTNNLSNVDLSGNMFSQLEGPITGLNKIKYLNLSSCFIQTIEDNFFDHLNSLQYLNLFQNLLGDCLDKDNNGSVFDKLDNLKYLNLSFNNLYRLHSATFKDMKNLETLDLSTNRLSHINFTVEHMNNLTFLDLHKNDIANLPKYLRDLVDSLLKANKSVRIDMSDNPIYCDCSNLEFLEWVISRKVFGGNYTRYYCKYPVENQTAVEMKMGYVEEVEKLRKQCDTHVGLFLGVIGGTLLVVAFIVGLLLYRFRWTLRYWFHAAKLKIYANPHRVSEVYEYDVFISYASEDVDFVLNVLSPKLSAERHLKLLVHGGHFQVGRHIADNIYMAIRECRKTLVLVTRNMLTSHWCTYELQMARMESINTGRDVLVFLFLEDIPTTLMNVEVMSYIKTSTYISYPEEARHRDAFWNKLADDLRAP